MQIYTSSLDSCTVATHQDLSSIPDQELPTINAMIISNCNLKSLALLPPNLNFLEARNGLLDEFPLIHSKLESVILAGNNLTQIPDLSSFNLKHLNISGNKLTNLPKLPITLEVLKIGRNQFATLPDLTYLINLKKLSCDNNALKRFGKLPEKLTIISCENNQLESFPEHIYKKMKESILEGLESYYSNNNFLQNDNQYPLELANEILYHIATGGTFDNLVDPIINKFALKCIKCNQIYLPEKKYLIGDKITLKNNLCLQCKNS